MLTIKIDTNSQLGKAITTAAEVCNLDPAALAAGMLYAAVKTQEAADTMQTSTTDKQTTH